MTLDLFAEPGPERWAGRYPMRAHPRGVGQIIELPDGELHYAPGFLDREVADRLLARLLANDRLPVQGTDWSGIAPDDVCWQTIAWRQDRLQMFGREVAQPRFSAWHGDSDRPYTYSGITLQPQPWNPPLAWLRDRLLHHCGVRFNSVLLNWYRSGEDHISWHADDEPELGPNPVIASVNLGATRRFLLRRRDDHSEKLELPLAHGSLLVMAGALQHHWQHAVPRERRVRSSRVNLTFRVIAPPGGPSR